MQGTVVLLLALGGLGCQNKRCDAFQVVPSVSAQCDAKGYANCVGMAAHPAWPASGSGCDSCADYQGGSLRSTLWSFVLGHDPEVRLPEEIEASVPLGRPGY
jgi:hypothetical protein